MTHPLISQVPRLWKSPVLHQTEPITLNESGLNFNYLKSTFSLPAAFTIHALFGHERLFSKEIRAHNGQLYT